MNYKLLILFAILLILGACEIEKPSLPIWDVDLKVPLINEHYYVSGLVDSMHLVVDDNNLLYLTTQGEAETQTLPPVEVQPTISANDLPVLSNIDMVQAIPFDDSQDNAALTYGEIASGEIKIQVANVHPDAGDWILELRILSITDPQGIPLQLSYTEPTPWQTIDLSSHHIGVLDSEETIDNLDVEITSSSALPDGSPLAEISLQSTTPITFHLFQGRLNHYEAHTGTSTSNIDIEYPLDLDEAITLHDAYIEIMVSNQIGFNCEFVGWFEATRGDMVVTIPIVDDNGNNFRVDASTVDNPALLTFSNRLSELMQIMPDHIEIVGGKFVIDSSSGYGSLRDTDIISAQYSVLAPFRFTLHDKPITINSPTKISISKENRQRISQNVLEAALSLQVLNTIPIGATAYAYFADHDSINVQDPTTYSFVKQMSLDSAQTNPDWQELESLSLNQAELDIFSAPDVYLKWVFHFEESTGLVEVHAGPDDFIWLKGQILAKLRVEDI